MCPIDGCEKMLTGNLNRHIAIHQKQHESMQSKKPKRKTDKKFAPDTLAPKQPNTLTP
jgi:hypothetical protein